MCFIIYCVILEWNGVESVVGYVIYCGKYARVDFIVCFCDKCCQTEKVGISVSLHLIQSQFSLNYMHNNIMDPYIQHSPQSSI